MDAISLKLYRSGMFVNLTSLTTLYLDDNYNINDYDADDDTYGLVGDLSLPVSLALVQSGVFKAVAPTGAPFDIVVPITVTKCWRNNQNGSRLVVYTFNS